MSLAAQSLIGVSSTRLNRSTIITYKYSTSDFIQKQTIFSEDIYADRFTGKIRDHHIEYNDEAKSVYEIEQYLYRHVPSLHSGIPSIQHVNYFDANYRKPSKISSYDSSYDYRSSKVVSYIAQYTLRFQDSAIHVNLNPIKNIITVIHEHERHRINIKIHRPLRCLKKLLILPHDYYKRGGKLNEDEIESIRMLGIGL